MNTIINRIERLINSTPTGETRNELTEINIKLYEQVNLCNTCIHKIPTCKGAGDITGGIMFGNGRGDDNIVKCMHYEYRN